MEFCSSCKGMMVPKNTKKGIVLACSKCGHEIKKFTANKYRIKEATKRDRTDILIVEEEKRKTSPDQRKYHTDLYGCETYESSDE